MAARRPRPEKKILSKQEVSSRKKALAVRRVEGTGVGHRALVGVAILALSSLALVALLTDPGPLAPRTAHNGAGPVGHALAALLGGLLGITAPAIPLAGVYVSGVLLVGKREKRRWPQVVHRTVVPASETRESSSSYSVLHRSQRTSMPGAFVSGTGPEN